MLMTEPRWGRSVRQEVDHAHCFLTLPSPPPVHRQPRINRGTFERQAVHWLTARGCTAHGCTAHGFTACGSRVHGLTARGCTVHGLAACGSRVHGPQVHGTRCTVHGPQFMLRRFCSRANVAFMAGLEPLDVPDEDGTSMDPVGSLPSTGRRTPFAPRQCAVSVSDSPSMLSPPNVLSIVP
jgi:hypothetical protein